MNRSRYALLRLLLPVAFLLLGCPGPSSTGQLYISGLGSHIQPGSTVSMLVRLVPAGSYEEAANREIVVDLSGDDFSYKRIFSGHTDEHGLLPVTFDVPADLSGTQASVTVLALDRSPAVTAGASVEVGPAWDPILTTDKPVYQPGQMLHMRTLALSRSDLHPAEEQTVTFEVTDPLGNLLLSRIAATSAFGIAAMDFPLDASAPTGFYELAATISGSTHRTSVEVKPYVLPRFEISFDPAQDGWLPGQTVTGTVRAEYFFGRPLAGAAVSLKGFVTDVERVEAVSLEGTTDADGNWAFSFSMPETFVVLPDEDDTGNKGNRTATLDIELAVTDTAGHTERTEESLTVAESPILIEISAESGDLVAGTINRLYIHTTDVGGNGIPAELSIAGDLLFEPIVAATNESGLAVVEVPAPVTRQAVRFAVDATAGELTGTRRQAIWVDPGLLLRTDRSEYALGDTILVDIEIPRLDENTEPPSLVYLVVEKIGTAKAVQPLAVVDGHAEAAIPLEGNSVGTLTLTATAGGPYGAVYDDTRYVLVNVPSSGITVTADATEYRPGGTAQLEVQVNSEGGPRTSAIGVSIVDESVFELGESEPGFVRTYFLLARPLLQPRHGIEGFVDFGSGDSSPYDFVPFFSSEVAPQSAPMAQKARDAALAGAFGQELASDFASRAESAAAAGNPAAASLWGYASRLPIALPLLGLAFYDGSRKRRRLLALALVLALASLVFVACASPAAPAAPAAEAPASEAAAPAGETTATRGTPQPTRLRQLFPETLLWLPEVITGEDGTAHIEVPIADSITTWRVSIVANDGEGHLGATSFGVPVFQPFFIEPDLPTHFTAGDEVTIPVAIYNYHTAPQVVNVSMAPVDGVELLGAQAQSVTVAANEVTSVLMPVRFARFGEYALRFDATAQPEDDPAATTGDAVERLVTVRPAGQQTLDATNFLMARADATVGTQEFEIDVAASLDPAASAVTVRIFPSALADVQQGFEALINAPYGCFEQVTTVTYLNALVLDYLEKTRQTDLINHDRVLLDVLRGLQQQMSYEVPGYPGGFEWYGNPPPVPHLTAYGLMSFVDTQRVTWVDPRLIERTASYLVGLQGSDGAWRSGEGSWYPVNDVTMTAQMVWALGAAGYGDTLAVQRGVELLLGVRANGFVPAPAPTWTPDPWLTTPPALTPFSGQVPPPPPSPLTAGGFTGQQSLPGSSGLPPTFTPTPLALPTFTPTFEPWQPAPAMMGNYERALAANALIAAGADASPFLEDLAAAVETPGYSTWGPAWLADGGTWSGGYGYSADLETTALATLAFFRSGGYNQLAELGLQTLLENRDPWGSFGNTQATLYTLMALLEQTGPENPSETTLTLRLGEEQRTVILPSDAVEVQVVRFEGVAPGRHTLTVERAGDQRPGLQVVSEAWVPWSNTGASTTGVEVSVAYDRSELSVDETVLATANVRLNAPRPVNMLLVELAVPPGFGVLRGDLDALVLSGAIDSYRVRGDRIEVYLSNLQPGQFVSFDYRLEARLVVDVETGPSYAYDFYARDVRGVQPPQRLVVRLND